jgi:translation initiation factor 1
LKKIAEKCPKCGNPANVGMCTTCSLPVDICACAGIDQSTQKIRIFIEKRKFQKPMTIIEGITENAKEISSQLKRKLATGGTFKKGHIELMGDHRKRLTEILVKIGYSKEQIEII